MRDLRVGTVLAGHRIDGLIGRGATSVVYVAEHLSLGRKVALKLLTPELAGDEGFRDRFIRESRVAAALDDPHVVTIYDAGEAEGLFYISMRYVEGVDLRRLLHRDGPLGLRRALSIAGQIGGALDAAHLAGLVHRDVKPANVLAAEPRPPEAPDHVFLSDFGITKLLGASGRMTRSGEFVGTVDYVAPEQILGEDVDGRADVYSLGCLLFEALTGTAPFRDRGSAVAVIYAHLNDPPAPLQAWDPELPPEVDSAVHRALAKRREDRFASCAELVAAASPARIATRASRSTAASSTHGPRRARRRSTRWIAVGLAVLVAMTGATALLIRRSGSRVDRSRGASSPTGSSSSSPPSPAATIPSGPVFLRSLSWARVPTQRSLAGPGDQTILRAIETTHGLVAVGYSAKTRDPSTHARNYDAAVWTSTKRGITWTKSMDPSLRLDGNQRATSVARIDGSLIVAGVDRSAADANAAVWRSTDEGVTWRRLDPRSTAFSLNGDQGIRDMVRTSQGLLAVGFDATSGSDDGAVWTSLDGVSWTRELPTGLSASGDQEMDSVVDLNGEVVATGYNQRGANRDAAVWTWRDGSTWSRAKDPSLRGGGNQQINMVTAGGPGFVAVGEDGNDAAVWTSADGERWDRVRQRSFAGRGARRMAAVTDVGGILVAVGTETRAGNRDGAIWVSRNGTHWYRQRPGSLGTADLAGTGVEELQWIMYGDHRLIALGRTGTARDDAAIWIAKIQP